MSMSSDDDGRRAIRRPHAAWLAAIALAALPVGSAMPAAAAGLDPLPAVAKALSTVTSYQVTITSSSNGRFPRPSWTPRPSGTPRPTGTPRAGRGQRRRGAGFGPGPQTRTIVAVRQGNAFEDYIVLTRKDSSGKTITMDLVVYGSRMCTRASGATSYTCRQQSGQFNFFNADPTTAFAQGAGSTVFAVTRAKEVNGQQCDGYTYINISPSTTVRGVVYIAHTTHLPCEQDETVTRQLPGGGSGSFTQKSTIVWSRFNDKRLTVPVVPGV